MGLGLLILGALVALWMVSISAMALRMTMVNSSDSYEQIVKIYSGISVGVGSVAFVFMMFFAYQFAKTGDTY